MRTKFLVTVCFSVAFLYLSPPTMAADRVVGINVGQPGPYEIHHYLHRPNSFDRAPYFATHPPVYYSPQRYGRSYGWTPFPYLGTQYSQPLVQRSDSVKSVQPSAAKPKRTRSGRRSNRRRGGTIITHYIYQDNKLISTNTKLATEQ